MKILLYCDKVNLLVSCSYAELLLKLWAIDSNNLKLISSGQMNGHTKDVNALA